MPELLFLPLQTLLLTFSAAAGTAIVLGTWPSPSGLLGVVLLYAVVGLFAEFQKAVPPDSFIFGQMHYDVIFTIVFLFLVLWTQSEFLRPIGYPRMTFNQATYIFVIVGITWSAFDYVARYASVAPK